MFRCTTLEIPGLGRRNCKSSSADLTLPNRVPRLHTGGCANRSHLSSQCTFPDKDAAATYLDLGFASRGFKDTELGAQGTFDQICWDAVVAVVNEANTAITNITTEQLKNAYDKNGNIANWQDLT